MPTILQNELGVIAAGTIIGPGIKSIQRGYVNSSNPVVTINSVDVTKSVLTIFGGFGVNDLSSSTTRVATITAFTSTSITILNNYITNNSGNYAPCFWQVIEYY